MHFDYIEIGTSDFDTLLQKTDLTGISIDPLKIYLDFLPDKANSCKINAAISDFDGSCDVYYIDPNDIKKYNLPDWLRGCNSVITPHQSAIKVLEEKNLIHIYKKESVDVLKWDTLVKNKSVTSIDYLKIDTEGHDCVIIKNIMNSECEIYPKKIKFEANILTSNDLIENTIALLLSKGYTLVSRDHENVTVKISENPVKKMIIGKAIFAVDDNPKYSGLWPIVSEICFKKLGIVPVLFHITEEDSDFYEDEYGLVKKVKRIPDIDAGKQSQIIRMWGTRYFPEEVCIVSDIDMMMFNREYFLDQVSEYSADDLVIYCSDAYDTARPECVGIYSDRYPIAYNAAKGKIFNLVLDTECKFDEYIRRVLGAGFPDFDSDEMYYTHCVNNKNHGVNVVKLKRGFYSKFKCPRRIDRIDDNAFNKYEDRLISSGHYVDCHLARPESQYAEEISILKNKILKTNEVYLIGCHIETPKQLSLLSELVGRLIDEGKDYIITSHTLVPEFILKNSVGFIYDSINPTYKIWELEKPNKYVIDYGNIRVESPYVTYGRRDYYHVGVLRLLLNGLRYLKSLNYDIIHWIEYDALPDFEEEGRNVKRLAESDFIFYGIGSKFSFRNSKVSKKFIDSTDRDILKMLSENDYVAEKVTSENLIDGKKIVYGVEGIDKFYGRHSHNSEMLFDWSIYDDNGTVCIFVDNKGSVNLKLTLRYSENIINIECHPRTWAIRPISGRNRMSDFSIESGGNVIVNLDLTDDLIYERMVKSVSVEIR